MIGASNFDDRDTALYKIEAYLLKPSTLNGPCACCIANTAEFQTHVWYDDREEEPVSEALCRACLGTELLLEWGVRPSTNTFRRHEAITGVTSASYKEPSQGPISIDRINGPSRQLWKVGRTRNHPRTRALAARSRRRVVSKLGTKIDKVTQGCQRIAADEVAWRPALPNDPSGTQIAVMTGDPNKPGLFSIRLKLPAGYKTMPHWHPHAQFITVLSGNLLYGIGDTWDLAAMQEVPAGGFLAIQPGIRHYAAAGSETILQVSGKGPNERILVH